MPAATFSRGIRPGGIRAPQGVRRQRPSDNAAKGQQHPRPLVHPSHPLILTLRAAYRYKHGRAIQWTAASAPHSSIEALDNPALVRIRSVASQSDHVLIDRHFCGKSWTHRRRTGQAPARAACVTRLGGRRCSLAVTSVRQRFERSMKGHDCTRTPPTTRPELVQKSVLQQRCSAVCSTRVPRKLVRKQRSRCARSTRGNGNDRQRL